MPVYRSVFRFPFLSLLIQNKSTFVLRICRNRSKTHECLLLRNRSCQLCRNVKKRMSSWDENNEAKLGTDFRLTLAVAIVSLGGLETNTMYWVYGTVPFLLRPLEF